MHLIDRPAPGRTCCAWQPGVRDHKFCINALDSGWPPMTDQLRWHPRAARGRCHCAARDQVAASTPTEEIMMDARFHQQPRGARSRASRLALILTLAAAFAAAARPTAKDDDESEWRMIGHDPTNTRNQPDEHTIGAANVHRLALKWVATTTGDVSATPAVVDDAVYFGDFGGTLWKLDARTGKVIWSHLVSDYTGIPGDIARTSPSLIGNTLVVGDLRHPNMLGIDARTGELRWLTQVHPDPKGIMTGSPVLSGDVIFTGISASGA